MFISKRLHNKIVSAKENEIEYEHLENYNHHQKLLAIDKLLKQQDYNSIENLKNKIRTILNNELSNNKTETIR